MAGAILVIIGINFRLDRNVPQSERHADSLHANLATHRLELYRLQAGHLGHQRWSLEEVEAWRYHQNSIVSIKQSLRTKRLAWDNDPIDERPAPSMGCFTKGMALARQFTVLFLLPFVLVLALALFIASPTQQSYLALFPDDIGTFPRTTVEPTRTAIAVVVVTPQPTSTNEFATPSILLATVTPTRGLVSTGTALPATGTAVPARSPTPTVTPTSTQRPVVGPPTSPPPPPTSTIVSATSVTTSPSSTPTITMTPVPPVTLLSPSNRGEVPGGQTLTFSLVWRDDYAGSAETYVLTLEHSGGTNYVVTQGSEWQVPSWLWNFQPADGYLWQVAVCAGAEPGEYASQPCSLTSRTSEVWSFKWLP